MTIKKNNKCFNFLVIGDWGAQTIQEKVEFKNINEEDLEKIKNKENKYNYKFKGVLFEVTGIKQEDGTYTISWENFKKFLLFKKTQKIIAKILALEAYANTSKFIINAGDNFYMYGVNTVNSEYWRTNYEDIYNDKSLYIPWFSVLGNHDYAMNPMAQIEYISPNCNRWQMPNRYYYKRIKNKNINIILIAIDTTPLVIKNRTSNSAPCSKKPWKPYYDRNCKNMKNNIINENPSDQIDFLEKIIDKLTNEEYINDWIILFGHHPLWELDVMVNNTSIQTIIEKLNPDIYFCGHYHVLMHNKIKYKAGVTIEQVVSGAGALIPLSSNSEEYTITNVNNNINIIIKFNEITAGFVSCNISNKCLQVNYKNQYNEPIFRRKILKKKRNY